MTANTPQMTFEVAARRLGAYGSQANNIVEQDHRAIKRITRPMLGIKSFWSAQVIFAGIETMHMIRKGQLDCAGGQTMFAAQQFYSLAV